MLFFQCSRRSAIALLNLLTAPPVALAARPASTLASAMYTGSRDSVSRGYTGVCDFVAVKTPKQSVAELVMCCMCFEISLYNEHVQYLNTQSSLLLEADVPTDSKYAVVQLKCTLQEAIGRAQPMHLRQSTSVLCASYSCTCTPRQARNTRYLSAGGVPKYLSSITRYQKVLKIVQRFSMAAIGKSRHLPGQKVGCKCQQCMQRTDKAECFDKQHRQQQSTRLAKGCPNKPYTNAKVLCMCVPSTSQLARYKTRFNSCCYCHGCCSLAERRRSSRGISSEHRVNLSCQNT